MKLLIGYDGSECAAEAIDDLRRAGLPPDDVEAVVLSIADVFPDKPGADYARLYPEAAERAQQQVDAALYHARADAASAQQRLSHLFPGWRISAEVSADSPYWGLVKKAQSWRADLLVVGSRGRSAVSRAVFGSVSHHAVMYADCTTRIGRCHPASAGSAARDDDAPAPPARILLGWDASPDATLAVGAVAARRWPRDSIVRLVTALDTRLGTLLPTFEPTAAGAAGAFPLVTQDERAHLQQRADSAAATLRSAGLLVDVPVLREGDPKRILLDEADAWSADNLFVGARGLSRIERVLLGSVSYAVAARAGCSVEVVRPPREPR